MNFLKIFKRRNLKTTLMGFSTILAVISGAVGDLTILLNFTSPPFMAIMAGIGLLFAKDGKVIKEEE